MSLYLDRLTHSYSTETDPVRRAEIAAQIAAVHARRGNFSTARQIIDQVQQGFGRGQSSQVTVMKMIAEGLIFHYEKLSPDANTRFLGALSIAKMFGYRQGVALAAAWKAHVEFERSDFECMVESLNLAIAHADPEQHDAWARIAAVLSNSYLICDASDLGHSWFLRGHKHAAALGDTETLDALLYNKAAFSVAALRVAACERATEPDLLARARSEVNSARNLRQLAGVNALAAHVDLLNAKLLVLERRFADAIDALEAVRLKQPFASHNFHQAQIDLDVAYCETMQARAPGERSARIDFPAVLEAVSSLDVDERLIAYWMLLEILGRDADINLRKGIAALFEQALQVYQSDRAELRRRLDTLAAC